MAVTRRTVTKSIAWATPAVLLGAAVPASAASTCVPTIALSPASFTCCAGSADKTMKLVLSFVPDGACIPPPLEICVTAVALSNGQSIGSTDGVPVCVALGDEFTIVLSDVQSCGTLILIDVTVDGKPAQTQVSATNIPGGSDEDCLVLRGGL